MLRRLKRKKSNYNKNRRYLRKIQKTKFFARFTRRTFNLGRIKMKKQNKTTTTSREKRIKILDLFRYGKHNKRVQTLKKEKL